MRQCRSEQHLRHFVEDFCEAMHWRGPDLSFLPRGLTIATADGEELRLAGPFTTFMPGIFAAGDVVHSLHSLEEALQEGRDVGQQIHRYLRQKKHSDIGDSDNPARDSAHVPGSASDKATH